MSKELSEQLREINRPQRYHRTDPWKQYPFDQPVDKVTPLESFLWGFVTGFCICVIVLVPGPW